MSCVVTAVLITYSCLEVTEIEILNLINCDFVIFVGLVTVGRSSPIGHRKVLQTYRIVMHVSCPDPLLLPDSYLPPPAPPSFPSRCSNLSTDQVYITFQIPLSIAVTPRKIMETEQKILLGDECDLKAEK